MPGKARSELLKRLEILKGAAKVSVDRLLKLFLKLNIQFELVPPAPKWITNPGDQEA